MDDHRVALTDRTLVIPIDSLLTNDRSSSSGNAGTGEVQIFFDFQYLRGSAFEDGGRLVVDPPADAIGGFERVDYTLFVDGHELGGASLVIHLVPPRIPIAGRWPSESCNRFSCLPSSALGHGTEIGFYDAVEGIFELCDWVGDQLVGCFTVGVPGDALGPGWRPLIGDWDGDGWDQLAVHNPASGEIRFAPIDGEGQQPGESISTPAGQAGSIFVNQPGVLVAADWFTSKVDLLGLYRPARGHFLIETPSNDYRQIDVESTNSNLLLPLTGDWTGSGKSRPSLWDPHQRQLRYFTGVEAESSEATQSWQSLFLSSTQAVGIPFATQLTDGHSATALGFYDPSHNSILLTPLSGTCESTDANCLTLQLQIPVDPGGGGSSGSSDS